MDVSVPSLLLKSVYVFGAIYLVVRAVAWLAKYFYQVKVINRMKGLPIIPFVGNAHQFAKRERNIYKLHTKPGLSFYLIYF